MAAKAVDIDVGITDEQYYPHFHPRLLHKNATSHKWVFGAIAELVDNAVNEIPRVASFVIVDKISNPRDGSPALLIQDDGGGMDREAIQRCMSTLGYSAAIGPYGNCFMNSTMRLGADAIVFSCHVKDGVSTQSIGLLSYTSLTQTGHDRIVVPMLEYVLNAAGNLEISDRCEKEYSSNLSLLLQWSPYSTEAELQNQFYDIGSHGTKVIIYNLWFKDDGTVELDFDTDPEDIRIDGYIKEEHAHPAWRTVNEQHIAHGLRYSLRAYLSILYLKSLENFTIALRGIVVEHHNLALDLKFPEFVVYRPRGTCKEDKSLTCIGFLNEVPEVTAHGFNIYHKNRLILPFHAVVNYEKKSRGVVGFVEANFIEPTHDKQDFKRNSIFQKFEVRLKQMTSEYWNYHCDLIGYQYVHKRLRLTEPPQDSPLGMSTSSDTLKFNGMPSCDKTNLVLNQNQPCLDNAKATSATGLSSKKTGSNAILWGNSLETEADNGIGNQLDDQDVVKVKLIQENKNFTCKMLGMQEEEGRP